MVISALHAQHAVVIERPGVFTYLASRCARLPVGRLLKIREALGHKLILNAEGGMESGFDAFKALALGTDAVTVERPLMEPLKEKAPEGLKEVLEAITKQLQVMMYRTASMNLKHIAPSMIWEK